MTGKSSEAAADDLFSRAVSRQESHYKPDYEYLDTALLQA